MISAAYVVKKGGRIALVSWLLALALQANADRYFTWVDANGQVHNTVIKEPEDKQDQDRTSDESTLAVDPNGISTDNKSAESRLYPELGSTVDNRQNTASEAKTALNKETYVLEGEEYTDAEVLEKRGFDQNTGGFYTIVDAEGNYINVPKQGQLPTATADQAPQNYQIVAREQSLKETASPGKADPLALQLLGIDQSDRRDIDIVAANCCEELLTFDRTELDDEDDRVIEIDDRDYFHQFGVGRSLLRVISLPEEMESPLYRLRSFAVPGIFYPSIITLDKDFQPVRLIQDILYIYEPANWFRHAYMEGFFTVQPEHEKYLILFSSYDDKRKRTVIESPGAKTVVLDHQQEGILNLANNLKD